MTHLNLTHARVDRAAAHRTDVLAQRDAAATQAAAVQQDLDDQHRAQQRLQALSTLLTSDGSCDHVSFEDDRLTVEVHDADPRFWTHAATAALYGGASWVGVYVLPPLIIGDGTLPPHPVEGVGLIFLLMVVWGLGWVGFLVAAVKAIFFLFTLLRRPMRVRAVVTPGDRYVERLAAVDVKKSVGDRRRYLAGVLRWVKGASVTRDPSILGRVFGMGRKA